MEFNPGDRIKVIDIEACHREYANIPINIGDVLGTILSRYENRGWQIHFDYDKHHDLNVPTYYVPDGSIALLEPAIPLPDLEDEEFLTKELKNLISKQETIAVIDGKFYSLTLQENKEVTAISNKLMKVAAQRIQEISMQARVEVQNEKNKIAKIIKLPEITKEAVQKGFRVYKNHVDGVGFFLPMKYAPKYMGKPEEFKAGTPVWEISKENQARMLLDILLNIEFDSPNHCCQVELYRQDFTRFRQYNGGCKGTLGYPRSCEMDELIAYRDKAEKTYEGLHTSHRGHDEPEAKDNMPTWIELWGSKIKIDKVHAWKVEAKKAEPGEYAIGAKVKVTKKDIAPFAYGMVGTIVAQNNNGAHWGVEFLDTHRSLHKLDGIIKEYKGCWFTKDQIKPVPLTTRRTHFKILPPAKPEAAPPARKGWHLKDFKEAAAPIAVEFPDRDNLDLLNKEDLALKFPDGNGEEKLCRVCGEKWRVHTGSVCIRRIKELEAAPVDESIAKFGIPSKEVRLEHHEIACSRCAERLGSHFFGNDIGDVVCPDEYKNGRRAK